MTRATLTDAQNSAAEAIADELLQDGSQFSLAARIFDFVCRHNVPAETIPEIARVCRPVEPGAPQSVRIGYTVGVVYPDGSGWGQDGYFGEPSELAAAEATRLASRPHSRRQGTVYVTDVYGRELATVDYQKNNE